MPGMLVADFTRKYDVTSCQVYDWRKQLWSGRLAPPESMRHRCGAGVARSPVTCSSEVGDMVCDPRHHLNLTETKPGGCIGLFPCAGGSCRRPFEMPRLGRRALAGLSIQVPVRLLLAANPSGYH